jgi:hypothetical protein
MSDRPTCERKREQQLHNSLANILRGLSAAALVVPPGGPPITVLEQFAFDTDGPAGVAAAREQSAEKARNPQRPPRNIIPYLKEFVRTGDPTVLCGMTFYHLALCVDAPRGATDAERDPEGRVFIACGDAGFTRAQLDAARAAGRTARDLAREYLARAPDGGPPIPPYNPADFDDVARAPGGGPTIPIYDPADFDDVAPPVVVARRRLPTRVPDPVSSELRAYIEAGRTLPGVAHVADSDDDSDDGSDDDSVADSDDDSMPGREHCRYNDENGDVRVVALAQYRAMYAEAVADAEAAAADP